MLALKLALVPGFLAALTMAGRVWGPSVAGWLAGLPVVAGPIVLLLALERGTDFAAQASAASIAAIAASEAFNFAYAWTCRVSRWPAALLAGLFAWVLVAVLLTHLPSGLAWSLAAACVAVGVSQAGLPRVEGVVPAARISVADLALRMLAGAVLTLAVTTLSASMGAAWSGVLSVFPLLGIVLAVSAQRAHGAPFVALLMRGMVIGRASFAAFFSVVALMLPTFGVLPAFACGAVVSVIVQGATKRLLAMSRKPRAPLAALD
ncbi:hypothetical protein ACFQ3P_16855 [Paraburkholderia sabiae]|jgi:hypothetical protein|uniref:Uncharacterized protein n=1 Tax=Paraburkholderia sabiae TaxID=273251 RepID=A0ABU9Q9X0_9BURK|nr:hypothetical protein [Paraburkholderia sabiae]WJZ75277.1 hypothetical protein QEN71_05595 [Paraburkholderia sabiae]CAD6534078.1 hypothetical protein LMG24235_02801 [Paraburkholderia sabiae]